MWWPGFSGGSRGWEFHWDCGLWWLHWTLGLHGECGQLSFGFLSYIVKYSGVKSLVVHCMEIAVGGGARSFSLMPTHSRTL